MRFHQGEMAIFAVATSALGQPYVGKECVVELVGPFKRGTVVKHPRNPLRFGRVMSDCDYVVFFSDDECAIPLDWQLRKIDPPAEPEAMTRTSDIDEEITA